MQIKPEHMEVIKEQFKGAVASLSPEQVIRFGFGMFAIGAVAAEMVLNGREKKLAAREGKGKA